MYLRAKFGATEREPIGDRGFRFTVQWVCIVQKSLIAQMEGLDALIWEVLGSLMCSSFCLSIRQIKILAYCVSDIHPKSTIL